MKLFIAEKPSLARAIADVLPKPHKKNDGYIETGNGDVVTWCIGHLLEQAPPEDYDEQYKKWAVEHLPIIPTQWQLKAKPKTRKQLTVIKKLIKRASVIVNAGDADREGQILVDEAISFCRATKAQIAQAKRCLISDMNASAVKKAVTHLKPNKDFLPLAVSALARARADWLYGLNMTRLCTLQGQRAGYQGVLSIGRVQTPILGLIVKRDLEIESFISKPFYEVIAEVSTSKGVNFEAKWQPSEACYPYMDTEKRVLSQALAANVVQRITGKEGAITEVTEDKKKQNSPLPFSLSGLQIAAAKAFGMSAKQVLDTCQQLYEKHKLITYPRSDCQYLPTEHLKDVPAVTKAVMSVSPQLVEQVEGADLAQRSRAWNDKKVSAHHAIIPTAKNKPSGLLNVAEKNIYNIVARQYIAQFYPQFEYSDKRVEMEISGGVFVSKQKDIIHNGWKSLFTSAKKDKVNNGNPSIDSSNKTSSSAHSEFSTTQLPQLRVGEVIHCTKGNCIEKHTSPPKPFTDATLISALTGIARFVSDQAIKNRLKETDGIGTEATRAGIIDLLFKRQFLAKTGKDIHATDVGKKLITALPLQISQPDMTALWESQLESISTKVLNYQSFIGGVESNLQQLIDEVKNITFTGLPQIKAPRKFARKRKQKKKLTTT